MDAKLKLAGLALITGLLLALFWPTLRWLAYSWTANPYYSHGFLVPAISAFLVWRRREALRSAAQKLPPVTLSGAKSLRPADERLRSAQHDSFCPCAYRPTVWSSQDDRCGQEGYFCSSGLALLAVGLAMHLMAIPWRIFPASALALIITLAGLALTFYGPVVARAMAFPLAFLATAIPVPFIERLSPPLEAFVARFATLCVRAIGVPASNLGSQVQLAGSAFVVGAPCSGLRSLVALITLTLLFTYLVHGPWWGKATLLLAAVPIALLANLARVSSLFLVANTWGADAGLQYYHHLSSPVLFLIAFSLLILVSRSVQCSEIRTDW